MMIPAATTTEGTTTRPRAALIDGLNHVAHVTRDLDRLTAFYAGVFDAAFTELPSYSDRRHGFLLLSPGTPAGDLGPLLHVFELPEDATGPFAHPDQMFRRGRLDHFAIQAADEHALAEVRDRLVAAGASDGSIRMFGGWLLSVHFVDPDGMELEICCRRSGIHFGEGEIETA